MFGPRHEYLCSSVKDIRPRILHRMLDKALHRSSKAEYLEPPRLPLQTIVPDIYGPHVDVSRAKVAFDRWALPKLRTELHDPNPLTVRQAINSIADIVHDPEKAYESIRLKIVDRMIDLLHSPDAFLRERCAMAMTTLAQHADGRDAILGGDAVHALHYLLKDDDVRVRHKVSLTVQIISRTPEGTQGLNEASFVPTLVARLLQDPEDIVLIHLGTLAELLDADVKEEAIRRGTMEVLATLLAQRPPALVAAATHCLALLAQHSDGKKLALQMGLLHILGDMLSDDDVEVRKQTALALTFVTLTTAGRLRAYKMGMLPPLLSMAANFHSSDLQVYSIKALTNLAEVPDARAELRQSGNIEMVNGIHSQGMEHLGRHVQTLKNVIDWEP